MSSSPDARSSADPDVPQADRLLERRKESVDQEPNRARHDRAAALGVHLVHPPWEGMDGLITLRTHWGQTQTGLWNVRAPGR